jgi:iron-sulfur cluster assembly accessory protein
MSGMAESKTALTPAADKFIRRMLRFAAKTTTGFRLKVRPGGCSGFAIEFDLAAEPASSEKVWEHEGLRIFLDRESRVLLDGATLDFQEGLSQTGFVITNHKQSAGAGRKAPAFVSVEALQKRW